MSDSNVIDLKLIQKIANEACDNKDAIEVIGYQLQPFSTCKVGFLGRHQKLEIEILRVNKEDSLPEKLKFFVKSRPRTGNEAFIQAKDAFGQEAEFFNRVLPRMREAVSAAEIEPWTPKCYFADDSIIVLENLALCGFSMAKNKLFQKESLQAAVRGMARMHAASMLLERQVGKPLNEFYPKACVERIYNDMLEQYGSNMFADFVVRVAKTKNREVKNLKEALTRGFDYIMREKHRERVFCHGDAWSNNYLFDASEPVPKCRLIDFQLVRYAPRMFDLAIMIYATTTQEIRKKEEKRAIEVYWTELCGILKKCDPDMERPSLEKEMKEFEKARLAGMLNGLVYLPVILLSENVHNEYKDKPAELKKMYTQRVSNDHILELMEVEAPYRMRMVDLVMDYVDKCEMLDVEKPEK